MTKIIGFAGKKQSGKNTMCNIWSVLTWQKWGFQKSVSIDRNNGQIRVENKIVDPNTINPKLCKIYSLADELKKFCCNVLGLDKNKTFGSDSEKNELSHIRWEHMPGIICNKRDYNIIIKSINSNNFRHLEYHKKGLMTNREVLQYFGTEIVRNINKNAWVNSCINNIKQDNPHYAFISDIRFPNEILTFKNAGTVIGLTKTIDIDTHESEKINLSTCDYIVDNKNSKNVDDLLKAIRKTFGPNQDLLTI